MTERNWSLRTKYLNNIPDTRNTPPVWTLSISSSALFIIPDYLICMRYPRVCVTIRETKQVQKRMCVAILAFFFSFWATETYETQPHANPVSHDFSPQRLKNQVCPTIYQWEKERRWMDAFLKGIITKWNENSFVSDLNSRSLFYFLRR